MALFEYWRDHPPVHEMIAAYLGVKPRSAKLAAPAVDPSDPSGIGGLVQQFPSGFVPANR